MKNTRILFVVLFVCIKFDSMLQDKNITSRILSNLMQKNVNISYIKQYNNFICIKYRSWTFFPERAATKEV